MDHKCGYKKATFLRLEDAKLKIMAINAKNPSLSIKDIKSMVYIY